MYSLVCYCLHFDAFESVSHGTVICSRLHGLSTSLVASICVPFFLFLKSSLMLQSFVHIFLSLPAAAAVRELHTAGAFEGSRGGGAGGMRILFFLNTLVTFCVFLLE